MRSADLIEYTAEEGVRILSEGTCGMRRRKLTREQPLTLLLLLAGKLLTSDAFPGTERTKLCMVSKARAQGPCCAVPLPCSRGG